MDASLISSFALWEKECYIFPMRETISIDWCKKITIESAKNSLRGLSNRFHILIHQTDSRGFEKILQSDRFAGHTGLNGTSLLTSCDSLDPHIAAVNGGPNNHKWSTHLVFILAPKIEGQEKVQLDHLDGVDMPLDTDSLWIGTDLVFGAFSWDSFIKNPHFQTRENYPRANMDFFTWRSIAEVTEQMHSSTSAILGSSLPPPPEEITL